MPYSQYRLLRKAAEIEEIRERLCLISDINAAFSGSKKHTDNLEKEYKRLTLGQKLNSEPDKDWVERLSRYRK